jgi:hypothetical protein
MRRAPYAQRNDRVFYPQPSPGSTALSPSRATAATNNSLAGPSVESPPPNKVKNNDNRRNHDEDVDDAAADVDRE